MRKIPERRLVFVADIHHGNLRIREIIGGRLAADDGSRVFGKQQAAGEKLVFVGTAGVGEDERIWHDGMEAKKGRRYGAFATCKGIPAWPAAIMRSSIRGPLHGQKNGFSRFLPRERGIAPCQSGKNDA